MEEQMRDLLEKQRGAEIPAVLLERFADPGDSRLFHVEPASVYTVRFRLKKKVKIT
ncbi:MAG: hypothetical protein SPL17_05640 [Bacteroidales bacterium]|nr:hypothetical protein [Bacteroidales bacterium]